MSYQDKNYSFNYIEDYDKFTVDEQKKFTLWYRSERLSDVLAGEITSSGNYYIKGFFSSVTLKLENKEIVHLFLKNLSISDVSKMITVLKRVPKSLGISSSPILMKKEKAEAKKEDKTVNTIHTLPFYSPLSSYLSYGMFQLNKCHRYRWHDDHQNVPSFIVSSKKEC